MLGGAAEVFGIAMISWFEIASELPQRVAEKIAKSESPHEIREILRVDSIVFSGDLKKYWPGIFRKLVMDPKIESFKYDAGSLAISKLSLTPGQGISGLGEAPGEVEIDCDDTGDISSQRAKIWSDTLIEIVRPSRHSSM